ncbi:hypothetical protein [Niveispirillum sp. KHB5.9]|uniref:hypothetical protein n=1 Tax=Niveispirillum sp. KHB5.9 TaxID=3400269 RepID=UPI003A83CD48
MTRTPPAQTSRFDYRTSRPGTGRGAIYGVLFDVRVRHGYYDSADGRCPDLSTRPTPETLDLIRDLGLVFKSRPDGFTLFYSPQRLQGMISWLRSQIVEDGEGAGCWARLRFQMAMANKDFVGLTQMPIDTSPFNANFFLCNSDAHGVETAAQGTVARLCPGTHVQTDDFVPVVTGSLTVTVPANGERVLIRDLSGAVVLTRDVSVADNGRVVVGFDTLACDRYDISVQTATGEVPAIPPQVVYSLASPQPLGLVDMLFTPPLPGMPGIYPLSIWPDGSETEPTGDLTYLLPFQTRSTIWQYFVVNAGNGGFKHLAITGDGADFAPPQPDLLPTGQPAIRFDAQAPLPLRRIPPERFRLSGTRILADGVQQDVQVDVLPTAPASPVWPGGPDGQCLSQMYVYV